MTGFFGDASKVIKKLQSIKKEMSDADFQERILEVRTILMTAQEENLLLRDKIITLEAEIKTIKDKPAQEIKSIIVEGFKFDDVDGKPTGLPYCPTCEVKEDGKLYRLSKFSDHKSRCHNCGKLHHAAQNGRVNIEVPSRNFY